MLFKNLSFGFFLTFVSSLRQCGLIIFMFLRIRNFNSGNLVISYDDDH
jgi:hypothetical protein